MDPLTVTASVVREVARDGNYGAHAQDVWRFAAGAAGQPLDEGLKDIVWLWIARHPAIRIEGDRAYASEELQWLELTGNPRQSNMVPQLAFNVLVAVAHSREAGISTVEVAKQAGQDPRSLFGRVQLLVDMGLVQRFPVIEKGSSTHRIVLAQYAALHTRGEAGDSASDNSFIDKEMARAQIVQYCQSGPQGLRLKRDIVTQVGTKLTSNAQRRRPLVVSLLKDLEINGFVRSTQVFDPESPTRAYACVQFVKEYDSGSRNKRLNSAWTDTTVVDIGEDGEGVDVEDEGAVDEANGTLKESSIEPFDLYYAVEDTPIRSNEVQANIVLPLSNQIHDLVTAAGSQGISTMELTRTLTGKSYSKALGKYLDALTGTSKSRSQKSAQPIELDHLSLIKGVDFTHRIKYYRYFTRMTFPGSKLNDKWGSFSKLPSIRNPELSLKVLDAKSKLPLPGGCSIIELDNGEIVPVFHGEKTTTGKVLLVSDPSRVPGASAAPAKRRGRPPKNAPRQPPPEVKPVPSPPVAAANKKVQSILIKDRTWVGGSPDSTDETRKPSVWLQRASTPSQRAALSKQALTPGESDSATKKKRSAIKEPSKKPKTAKNGANSPSNADDGGAVSTAPDQDKPDLDREPSISAQNSVGSLAFARRVDTLFGVVRSSDGAVIGGQDLVDRFNAAVGGDSLVDRKTIDRVTKNLVKQGALRQIFVNVPTMTGLHLMKYILYDPAIIPDADNSELITKLKLELNEGTRSKQIAAAKAAAGAQKLVRETGQRQQMTSDQANAFRPLLHQRLVTTSTRRRPAVTHKFGASAADVAQMTPSGELASPVSKRARRTRAPKRAPQNDADDFDATKNTTPSTGSTSKPRSSLADAGARLTPVIDHDWLWRAVIIVRSLFARGKNIDWALIASSAPLGLNEKMLRQSWPHVRDDLHGGSTELANRTCEWEDSFIEAYAADEIVLLKPSDPGFTLDYYISWWRASDEAKRLAQANQRGGSSKRLGDIVLKPHHFDSRLHDPLSSLQSQPSMIRAEELLVKTAFGVPLDDKAMAPSSGSVLKLSDNAAKLRAVIAADSGASFSAKEAAKELNSLSEDEAKQALSELERHKYVQWAVSDPGKIPSGRPYILSERIMNLLAPPAKLEPDLPERSQAIVADLPTSGSIEIQETVDESVMIPLLEMATLGLDGRQLRLRRSGERSGRLSAHYRSRDIDKGELDCDIHGEISEADPATSRVKASPIQGPKSANSGHPRIWETSHLESNNIWKIVAYKLLATVLFRPGITEEILSHSLRHVLEREEVSEAVEALVAGNALLRDGFRGLQCAPNWFELIPPGHDDA